MVKEGRHSRLQNNHYMTRAAILLPLIVFSLLSPAHAAIPQVAAGNNHTIGLKSDGSVVAVGDNTFGQLNLSNWTDMVQVSAGQHHSVGLNFDGRVVAVGGSNNYGQLNVSDWSNIVQVCTGWNHTVGLKSDGSVVAVGKNIEGQLAVGGWSNIVKLAAGGNHTVGLKSNGSVVAVGEDYKGQLNVSDWSNIVQVAAGYAQTYGLKSDGSVVAVGSNQWGVLNVSDWSDIVQVDAAYYQTVGLKSDGSVVTVGWDFEGLMNANDWTNILHVAAGQFHTVGLKSDGSVVAVGRNMDGQCNVSNWDLGQGIAIKYTNRTPEANLVNLQPEGQLKFLSGAEIDPSKMTIVITHGWNPTFAHTPPGNIPPWIENMGNALARRNKENILWWDWLEAASSLTPLPWSKAASNAPDQGNKLAAALLSKCGENYNQAIHFIGHSMGARVNRRAVMDIVSQRNWADKIHITILDAAEFSALDPNDWDGSIPSPNNFAFIDNYISAFGDLHPELNAANAILPEGEPNVVLPGIINFFKAYADFHGSVCNWYIKTINEPLGSDMGFQWSFEYGSIPTAPIENYYVQTSDTNDFDLNLENIDRSEAETILNSRNTKFVTETSILGLNLITQPLIEAVGDAAVVLVPKGTEWTLRLLLNESSPAYAWIPISIPPDAEFLSFDFTVKNCGDGDYLTAGIQDKLMFAFNLMNATENQIANSGYLDISLYAGTSAELFIGLNSVGGKNAKLIIDNIMFHSYFAGDIDNDGDVDGTDLVSFINSIGFSSTNPGYKAPSDTNRDSIIDMNDLPKFAEKFGKTSSSF